MFDIFDSTSGFVAVTAVTYASILFALSFLVVYVLGAVRRDKSDNPDRFLGARVFLLMMVSLSFQISLFGLSQTFASAMKEGAVGGSSIQRESENRDMDLAIGILLGGLISAIYPTVIYILVRLRDARKDPVFRSALGLNAIITGALFTVLVTALMIDMMLEQGSTDELVAGTLVYLGGSLLCGIPLALAVAIGPASSAAILEAVSIPPIVTRSVSEGDSCTADPR